MIYHTRYMQANSEILIDGGGYICNAVYTPKHTQKHSLLVQVNNKKAIHKIGNGNIQRFYLVIYPRYKV
jgi:hypothetical protein